MPAKTREKLFGQWDHVRMYGPDFEQRISESGFEVHVLKAEQMPQAVQQRYGFQAETGSSFPRRGLHVNRGISITLTG